MTRLSAMWCIECQQDVPAVVSSRGDGRLCCSRCANELPAAPPASQGDEPWDDWDLDADLSELESLAEAAERPQPATIALPAATLPAAPTVAPPVGPRVRTGGAWLLVMLGTAATFFGAVLVAWSFWVEQPVLWRVGLPSAVAGQTVLLMGMVLLLDAASETRRWQDEQLRALRSQLEQVERLQAAGQGGGSMMGKLVAGAGPERLLADIRSQLEALAARVA